MKVPKETLEEQFEFEMIEMKQQLPTAQKQPAKDDCNAESNTETSLTEKTK